MFRPAMPAIAARSAKALSLLYGTVRPHELRSSTLGLILRPASCSRAALWRWEAVVDVNDLPPYVSGRPLLGVQTLIGDGMLLFGIAGRHAPNDAGRFVAAAGGGVALALFFNHPGFGIFAFPYGAVILQVTPVIAIAPFLLSICPQQTAVIVGAWIVGFFPVLSEHHSGLNSSIALSPALFQLYGSSRVADACGT